MATDPPGNMKSARHMAHADRIDVRYRCCPVSTYMSTYASWGVIS
jgi:hypothetical protein